MIPEIWWIGIGIGDWGLEMDSIGTYPSSWASRVRDNIFECDEGSGCWDCVCEDRLQMRGGAGKVFRSRLGM
jgi:hypothetical protein